MNQFLKIKSHFLIYITIILLNLVNRLQAANYIVTAETSKIYCSNGNMVIMKPFQVLELTEEVDRETYQVRLPSKFSKKCPEGQVSSITIYNLGNLAPKSKTNESPQRKIIRKSKNSNPLTDSNSKENSFRNPETSEIDTPDLYAITRPHVIHKPKRNNFRRPKIKLEDPEDVIPETKDEDSVKDQDPYYSPFDDKNVLVSSRSANNYFKKITKHLVPLCREKFLGSEGFGPWGEHAKDVLNRAFFEKTLLLNHTAFNDICPAWKYNMSPEQKKNLIVLTLLGASNWESSCNQSVRVKCPNGTCAGILQLDLGKEKKYITYSKLKDFCPNYVSKTAEGSISCSLGMFIQDLWQGEKIVGNNKSYWEVFAPKYKNDRVQEFKELIGQVPDCHISSSNSRLVRNLRIPQSPLRKVVQTKKHRITPIKARDEESDMSLLKGTI